MHRILVFAVLIVFLFGPVVLHSIVWRMVGGVAAVVAPFLLVGMWKVGIGLLPDRFGTTAIFATFATLIVFAFDRDCTFPAQTWHAWKKITPLPLRRYRVIHGKLIVGYAPYLWLARARYPVGTVQVLKSTGAVFWPGRVRRRSLPRSIAPN